jgi:hypothetical protein
MMEGVVLLLDLGFVHDTTNLHELAGGAFRLQLSIHSQFDGCYGNDRIAYASVGGLEDFM